MTVLSDHQICGAIRRGREITDLRSLVRCWERGLVDLNPTLTGKGVALLDGIEPTACSGAHMNGAPPVGEWRAARLERRAER